MSEGCGVRPFMPNGKKYATREEREQAFEAIVCDIIRFKVDGKSINPPGITELVNIYMQAEQAGGRHE